MPAWGILQMIAENKRRSSGGGDQPDDSLNTIEGINSAVGGVIGVTRGLYQSGRLFANSARSRELQNKSQRQNIGSVSKIGIGLTKSYSNPYPISGDGSLRKISSIFSAGEKSAAASDGGGQSPIKTPAATSKNSLIGSVGAATQKMMSGWGIMNIMSAPKMEQSKMSAVKSAGSGGGIGSGGIGAMMKYARNSYRSNNYRPIQQSFAQKTMRARFGISRKPNALGRSKRG